jgi:hypothetical protein
MEYNNNTYVTIPHTECENLGLGENHRKNNDGTLCILEYSSVDAIPTEVSSVMVSTYTHQQALELVSGPEWTSEMPK